MWTLDHSSLPDVPSSPGFGTLVTIDLGYENPPLATIDYQAQWYSPGIVRPWTPSTTTQIVPAPGSTTVTFAPTATDLVHLDVVQANGQTFQPAQDPDNPAAGEFTWQTTQPQDFDYEETDLPIDSVTLTLSEPSTEPLTITLTGGKKRSTVSTNALPPKLLKALKGLPVTGDISWTLSLEQHPSGSMELFCQGDTIHSIRDRFKKGTEWELFGIGFSVSNYQEKLEPFRQYRINISLTGKWAKPRYNRPSFLRPEAWKAYTEETALNQSGQSKTKISIKQLAEQVDVPFFPLGDANWDITLAADTAKDAAEVWSSSIQERSRPNEGYIDWNDANGVHIRKIRSGRHWRYSIPELEISYQGDCEHSDDHRGYAVEYPNVELTGDWSNLNANQEPKPEWKRRTPQIVTLVSGDADADATPSVTAPLPEGVNRLADLSLNWDSSGPTRTIRFVTTLDGQPYKTIEVIWGFCYTGLDIYNSSTEELDGNPIDFWQIVSYKEQNYLYDPQYGYPLGYNTTGWRMARFKQEGTNQEGIPDTEVLDRTDALEALEYDLYVFRKLPILERSRTVHTTFTNYYKDAEEQPAWVSYQHTNRDGSTETRFAKDPTWAPAMFGKETLTYASSFAKAPNPEYDPGEDYILPEYPPPQKYYITGEESFTRQSLTIKPGRKNRKVTFQQGDNEIKETVLSPDLYTEWNLEDAAQNSQFGQKAVKETFAENEGRPSPSTRLPSLLEQEEPESNDANSNNTDSSKYRYTMTSPGYSTDDPVESSLSYSNAKTQAQTILGAKTDFYLRDVQESIQYTYPIPFNPELRPLDRITINAQGETHATAVASLTNTLAIDGNVEGELLITSKPTEVNAGIDRIVPLEDHKTRRPELSDSDNTAGDDAQKENPKLRLTIGSLFKAQIQNRGNY